MNMRVIRNLALIGMMGGALFANKVMKKAHAEEFCYDCVMQENQCYTDACEDQTYCPPQPDCADAYAACEATCTD